MGHLSVRISASKLIHLHVSCCVVFNHIDTLGSQLSAMKTIRYTRTKSNNNKKGGSLIIIIHASHTHTHTPVSMAMRAHHSQRREYVFSLVLDQQLVPHSHADQHFAVRRAQSAAAAAAISSSISPSSPSHSLCIISQHSTHTRISNIYSQTRSHKSSAPYTLHTSRFGWLLRNN